MKNFLKFIIIFAVILLLSAFLAPIFYDIFQKFHPYKIERIFNRLVMIGTLIAAVLFVRIRKGTLERYGLIWNFQSPGLLIKGFVSGMLLLGGVSALRLFSGQAVFAPDAFPWTVWAGKIAAALGTGLLIGVMEEFFFRGFVFRSLEKMLRNRTLLAILVTTVFYSIIHFIGMKKIFVDSTPTFFDGLRLMGAPFLSLAEWPKFWPEAVGLFLFGLALNTSVCRSGSLYPAIGLHAGCVFFIRLDDLFMKQHASKTFFWGSKVLYDGCVGWAVLILMGLLMWMILKPAAATKPEVSLKQPPV